MKRTYSRILVTVAVLAAAGLLLQALPWKNWIENTLRAKLEQQGLKQVQLTVGALGWRGLELTNITIGDTPPFTLNTLTLGYSLPQLFDKQVHDVALSGLTLDIKKSTVGWEFLGLGGMRTNAANGTPIQLPVTRDAILALPLDRMHLQNSTIRISNDLWQLAVPLQLTWQKLPLSTLTADSSGISFKLGGVSIITGPGNLQGVALEKQKPAEEEKWQGNWNVKAIAVHGLAVPLPPMDAAGTLTLLRDTILADGTLQSIDKTVQASFSLTYHLNALQASRFTLQDAKLPWGGGVMSVQGVSFAVPNPESIHANLQVKDVDIAPLMKSLTSNRAAATGKISGTLPVTLGADGTIEFQQGLLTTSLPGIVTLAPEVIPGDNPQVALVRDILKNLHYSLLSLTLNSGDDHKLSALLSVQGNNPDLYGGKPVKLNVHLTGDVLNLIRQNRVLLNDPESLLKKQVP